MTASSTSQNTTADSHFAKMREVLKLESEAISRAAVSLDPPNVDRTIELLQSCNGKVIVTGVGKSGVIAEKIAQTLTSTGTVAVFVHPSDAIHGGFGCDRERRRCDRIEQFGRDR